MGGKCDAVSLAKAMNLPESSIFPLSNLLQSKGYVKATETISERLSLTEEGLYCLKNDLPENRMMKLLSSNPSDEGLPLNRLEPTLKPIEISAAIGWGRKSGAIRLDKRGNVSVAFMVIPRKSELDGMLEKLETEPEKSSLTAEDQKRALILVDRGLAVLKESKNLLLEIVRDAPLEISANVLTSELIRSNRWREVTLRPYDVTASPPSLKVGKKHPYLEFLNEAKEILFAMGFEETVGPYVENEFWNFDALFMAQDHPARAVHDNFQVKGTNATIDAPEDLIERVRIAHESGGQTGSKGWGYHWSIETARGQILRTHTTAVSVRSLSTRKTPPVKTFCLSKVFRPDVIDSRHMLEFSQLDGIMGDKGINVRHLLGVLTEFANQLGFKEIKFTPGYFPFTEPSIEAYVKHPTLGWIECLGSGLFRPEVLWPLGITFPVIAWGIGIDRLAMVRLGLDNIKELHTGDIDSLRQWGWW
jgi:phenylalanyl-tRNA synthetase alpha chain